MATLSTLAILHYFIKNLMKMRNRQKLKLLVSYFLLYSIIIWNYFIYIYIYIYIYINYIKSNRYFLFWLSFEWSSCVIVSCCGIQWSWVQIPLRPTFYSYFKNPSVVNTIYIYIYKYIHLYDYSQELAINQILEALLLPLKPGFMASPQMLYGLTQKCAVSLAKQSLSSSSHISPFKNLSALLNNLTKVKSF